MNRHISFRAWRPGEQRGGCHLGTIPAADGLTIGRPAGRRHYRDPHAGGFDPGTTTRPDSGAGDDVEWAAWVTPAVTPGHGFTSLVPSWNARTPDGSWIEVAARVSSDDLRWSRWYTLGRWAEEPSTIRPTTVPGQSDADARLRTEELLAPTGTSWSTYQLRVALHRPAGSRSRPLLTLLGAVASTSGPTPDCSPAGGAGHGLEVPVPPLSQQVHRDEHPQWGSGGEAWCSPTATTMLLQRWGLGPAASEYAWVDPDCPDRVVDHAVRHVFDHAYGGTGNWSFNTAYAGRYGAEAFVTRLRSLAEAELFVAAGIPLAASVSFRRGELDGAGYDTAGHLLTVVGFDGGGRVICNDPASHEIASNDEVRTVYDRHQFERVWQQAAGGLVYVIRPVDVPLPGHAVPAEPNW